MTESLTARAVAILERPALIGPPDVALAEQVLGTAGLPGEVYEQALRLLAAIIYSRPDIVGPDTVAGLKTLLTDPPPGEATYRAAVEMLTFLLATPAAPAAIDLLLSSLARPDQADQVYAVLLNGLEYAAFWARPALDLAALVHLAEQAHLADWRERLLQTTIEPALLASPATVSVELLERLIKVFAGQPGLKYPLHYLAGCAGVADAVRRLAQCITAPRFPLHELVQRHLGEGSPWVLVVQNIADGQGDEIIRVVPLLDALLRFNPRLEVVLFTRRAYLYSHSRLTLVAIDDRAAVEAVLRDRFDAVVECSDAAVVEVNCDQRIAVDLQALLLRQTPFLRVNARKDWNHFVYERVDLQGRAYAGALGLAEQRIGNVYETTFRLLSELGLPLRLGEDPPEADSVLAGLPCAEADQAWAQLVQGNTADRPVVLVCPFGGAEPLKGFVERQASLLAKRLSGLIEEGWYVVLLPNGLSWGSANRAREVVSHLTPAEREQLVIAPDPAERAGQWVTYQHAGWYTVPAASYQMRLVTYFVRFADLIVTVEGWLVHAAYCLGRPYRTLMLPYSHRADWQPYGSTSRQQIVGATDVQPDEAREPDGDGPLPEQPRKLVLLSLLRALGRSGEASAVGLLRWALRSEDRELRQAATEALGRFSGAEIEPVLRALLVDPANRVRAAAAAALLERRGDAAAGWGELPREQILAHQAIGREARSWAEVLRLGEGARAALEVARQDDDLVVRREATWAVRSLDLRRARMQPPEPSAAEGRTRNLLPELINATENRGRRMVELLRGLGRRAARPGRSAAAQPAVLILTPVKDAADCLDGYCRALRRLTYPRARLSIGLLESDSSDSTWHDLERRLPALRAEFKRVGLWKQDFGYQIPPGLPRWAPSIQVERRGVLAKSRNHLLFRALDDEAWVLWLDVDVVEYPPDLIERLLATGKDIVQPHCVLEYGGPTFDLNGWRDHGRLHLDDLRAEGELVELDAVGGTVLLVRADLHREGLIYPTFLYGQANPRARPGGSEGRPAGEIETEGLGIMAHDMGYRCWGLPYFEVIHRRQ